MLSFFLGSTSPPILSTSSPRGMQQDREWELQLFITLSLLLLLPHALPLLHCEVTAINHFLGLEVLERFTVFFIFNRFSKGLVWDFLVSIFV